MLIFWRVGFIGLCPPSHQCVDTMAIIKWQATCSILRCKTADRTIYQLLFQHNTNILKCLILIIVSCKIVYTSYFRDRRRPGPAEHNKESIIKSSSSSSVYAGRRTLSFVWRVQNLQSRSFHLRGRALLCSWTLLAGYSTSCPVLIRTLWRWEMLPLLPTKNSHPWLQRRIIMWSLASERTNYQLMHGKIFISDVSEA